MVKPVGPSVPTGNGTSIVSAPWSTSTGIVPPETVPRSSTSGGPPATKTTWTSVEENAPVIQ